MIRRLDSENVRPIYTTTISTQISISSFGTLVFLPNHRRGTCSQMMVRPPILTHRFGALSQLDIMDPNGCPGRCGTDTSFRGFRQPEAVAATRR